MSPRWVALAALLALAAPSAASDVGVRVRFPNLAVKSQICTSAVCGTSLLESGDSEPLPAPIRSLLVNGEAAAGDFGAEMSVDGGPWTASADGDVEDGNFWFRFDLPAPAGARVRIRFVSASAGAQPAWLLIRGADGVGSAAGSLAGGAVAGSAVPPPIGGAPGVPGPPEPVVRPRADWGARAAKDPYELMIPGGISIHHTETTQPRGANAAVALLHSIQSFHQRGRGWSDIAYHFLIDGDGTIWQGRPGPVLGAHVKDRNDGNIGIAIMGDFEEAGGRQPTPQQLESLHALAAWLSWRYSIPVTRILGHRDQEQTACPGDALYARLGTVRAEAGARRAAASAGPGVASAAGAPEPAR